MNHREMRKLVIFYVLIIIITTSLVAYAMRQDKDDGTLAGDWVGGNGAFTLHIDRNELSLDHGSKKIVQTSYKVAGDVLQPEQDWFVEQRYCEYSLRQRKGTIILTIAPYQGENIHYLLKKGGK